METRQLFSGQTMQQNHSNLVYGARDTRHLNGETCGRQGLQVLLLWLLCLVAGLHPAGMVSARADDTYTNNDVSFLIRVERDGRLRALSEIPSLEYGDLLHVRLINARGYHEKFPHVANQRVNSMPENHGLMLIGAFVQPNDRSGLGREAFARPFLAPDGSELLIRVTRNNATPFLMLIPAIYDGKREGEWEDFVRDVVEKPELKGLRDFLLREFATGTAGGEVGIVFKEGDDPDSSLQTAQFLLPRIAAANRERGKPEFQQLTRSQQTERLYKTLGTEPPNDPGAYGYVNSFLDAFISNNPNDPVRMPDRNTFGALLKEGLTFLPEWYSAPLRSLEVFGKLGVLITGLNRRPKRDEKYFVSVRWTPQAPERATTAAGAATPAFEIGNVFRMEPIERLEEKGSDGRRRKNVLIASLGRTGFRKAVVKPTVAVPNKGGIVYLSNNSQVRQLTLDNSSPLSPDQMERFAGSLLHLHIADGGDPIPLQYDPKNGTFLLQNARPFPLKPVDAVIRGDWGHNGKVQDLSQPFQVSGVEPGSWSVENAELMMAGSSATLRLRTDKPIEPWKVVFRYNNGATVAAQEIAATKEPGVYTAKFDLNGQRAGTGRLEIHKPPEGMPPDTVSAFAAGEGRELPLQVFDPVRRLQLEDTEYFAYDRQMRVNAEPFTPNTLPEKITLGDIVFQKGSPLKDGWIAYTTETPFTQVRIAATQLHLKDGRILPYNLRVRPRRPTFSVVERLRENPPSPFPWELPDQVATQYSALEIELKAAEGYRFPPTAQLMFGPIAIRPDIIPTGVQGAESLLFTLDPRVHTNLRGALTGRLVETRDGNENVSSEDFALGFRLAQVPDVPVSLQVVNGKYRLIGRNVNVIERAGPATQMQTVMATGTGDNAYIEFTAPPGMPIYFQPRMLEKPLRWAGPLVPQTPSRPVTTFDPERKTGATVKWEKVAGATEYQVYRGTEGNVPVMPSNRVATVAAGEAATYAVEDTATLEPGTMYQYRVVAVSHIEGFRDELFPPEQFRAIGEPSEAFLTRPGAPLTVAVSGITVEGNPAALVRFSRGPGASRYRIYRGTSADFAPLPENKVAEIADTGAEAPTWEDRSPLTPGVTYFYKVVAVAQRDGLKETSSPPSPVSNGYTVPGASPPATPGT
ncbi:MAG: hypothetical protein OHK0029_22540 [Armatimonadaceae bacterium]